MDYIQERSHAETLEDALHFRNTGQITHGVRGISPLFAMENVDIIKSVPIDDMHGLHIGVTGRLLDCWFDSTNHRENYYLGLKQKFFDSKLTSIKPPSNDSRKPRSLTERKFWKASEKRRFLLNYAVPVLHSYLPDKYLMNLSLLSDAVFKLSSKTINRSELPALQQQLSKFTRDYQSFYGVTEMTYNIHLVGHLIKSVRETGPLWTSSNYHFENNNGILAAYVHGTTDPIKQIFTKYSLKKYVLHDENTTDACKNYMKIINQRNKIRSCLELQYCTLFNEIPSLITERESALLGDNIEEFRFFKKIIYKNEIFTIHQPKIATNDSTLHFTNGNFGVIQRIVLVDNLHVKLIVQVLELVDMPLNNFLPGHSASVNFGSSLIIEDLENVINKCVLIKKNGFYCVSILPNKYEKY